MEGEGRRFVAFLRGINVGGHRKVPMAELKLILEKFGFQKCITLLNSGNVIFSSTEKLSILVEKKVEVLLEDHFGFPIPTIVRPAQHLLDMVEKDPFKGEQVHDKIRLYCSFLKEEVESDVEIPWVSPNVSYRIIKRDGKEIYSILDLTKGKTPDAMKILEQNFGKDITTRNWKTVVKVVGKV